MRPENRLRPQSVSCSGRWPAVTLGSWYSKALRAAARSWGGRADTAHGRRLRTTNTNASLMAALIWGLVSNPLQRQRVSRAIARLVYPDADRLWRLGRGWAVSRPS